MHKALLFLPLLSLLKGPDSATPFRYVDAQNEQYRVYSALIEQKVTDKTGALVFIEATTLQAPLDRITLFKRRPDSNRWRLEPYPKVTTMNQSEKVEHLKKKLSLISQATIDDYLNKGKRTVRLKRAFDGMIKYRLMSGKQYRQMRDESQNKLSELISFSRVGFNVEGTQALVFMETHGGTDGETFFVLLEKDGSKWVIKQSWNGQ